jgi:predicted nucleic acid-binding protein
MVFRARSDVSARKLAPRVSVHDPMLKWFLPEVHSDAARALLDPAHEFVVPDLLFPEVANAIWKKARRSES